VTKESVLLVDLRLSEETVCEVVTCISVLLVDLRLSEEEARGLNGENAGRLFVK